MKAESRMPVQETQQQEQSQQKKLRRWDWLTNSAGVIIIIACTLGFGFGLPTDASLPKANHYDRISAVIGWCYFSCWSISFYPQVYDNWKRGSVTGFSFDFGVYNLLGFGCYAIFNCAFYWSEQVQAAYAELHDGRPSAVQANDVFFSVHAVIITVVTLMQCVGYERGGQRVSDICKLFCASALLVGVGYAIYVGFKSHLCSCFAGLAWLYLLSYIKLAISIFKYIPQVMLNYRRQSTVGWNIQNVLLDLTGGLMSLGQLLGDSYVKEDWSSITGDPVKFGLGFTSLFFDAIFIAQHYWLYRGTPDPADIENAAVVSSSGGSNSNGGGGSGAKPSTEAGLRQALLEPGDKEEAESDEEHEEEEEEKAAGLASQV